MQFAWVILGQSRGRLSSIALGAAAGPYPQWHGAGAADKRYLVQALYVYALDRDERFIGPYFNGMGYFYQADCNRPL